MKKLLALLLLFLSLYSQGQDTIPTGTIKLIQSPAIYFRPADSTLWMYKNRVYKWNKLATSSPISIMNGTTLYSSTLDSTAHNSLSPYSVYLGPYAGYGTTNINGNNNFFGLWAGQNATNVQASNFFGVLAGKGAINATNSNFIGADAGLLAVNAENSNFLGGDAGLLATNAAFSNFFGSSAGSEASNASNSNFLGTNSGFQATGASSSNFFGSSAGESATNASNSNFFGYAAGINATYANYTNAFGNDVANSATHASFSNLFGSGVGRSVEGDTIGKNNIIIGTYVTVPNEIENAINLGGVLFGKNTHFEIDSEIPSADPEPTGKIGIGVRTDSITARLHIGAGSSTAGMAPLKINPGTLLTTPEPYAIETDGMHLYWSNSDGDRDTLDLGGTSTPSSVVRATHSVRGGIKLGAGFTTTGDSLNAMTITDENSSSGLFYPLIVNSADHKLSYPYTSSSYLVYSPVSGQLESRVIRASTSIGTLHDLNLQGDTARVMIGSGLNAGTAGQVLTSGGAASTVYWSTPGGGGGGSSTVQSLSGTSPSWDVASGVHARITLTGATTISMSGISEGQTGNLTVTNASTAYSITISGYISLLAPNVYNADEQLKTSGGSHVDVFSWYYDGESLFWNGTHVYTYNPLIP